ncbi:MAG: diguanylate cyclase [Longimicrobiales bacterium]|nr:diguanylate cyclase [Longimicrobiales bacterium]
MPRPTDPRLIDELTGLSNEWHFQILFDFAFAGGDRGIPLTIVLFEIEAFEDYRREQGSDAAAEVLRAFGRILGDSTREMDVTVRLHGARFLSLLRDCNLQGGLVFVDRIQVRTSLLEEEHGLKVAMGVAAYEDGMKESDELLDAAKRALARSLEMGAGTVSTSRDV